MVHLSDKQDMQAMGSPIVLWDYCMERRALIFQVTAKNEGNVMAQWILKENGKVVPWRTLRRLTSDELAPSNEVRID